MTAVVDIESGPDPEATPGPVATERVRRVTFPPVVSVIVRRLLMAIPLLFVVTAIAFVLISLAPGDPAAAIIGPDATDEQYQSVREELGLNDPLWEQYGQWAWNAMQGDLGKSLVFNVPVTDQAGGALRVSVSLFFGAFVLSVPLGIGVGVYSAVRGGLGGKMADGAVMVGYSIPGFWLASFLVSIFAVHFKWFPAVGYVPPTQSLSGWAKSITLPVVALTIVGLAGIAKQTSEAMADVLREPYIVAARANGVTRRSIIYRHALRNAALPVVTVLGIRAIGLLSGTVFVEQVFAMPGLGSLAVDATLQQDFPMILGATVYFTLIVIIVNLVIDLLYAALNPRVMVS